jgi:hypothetical protein
MTLTRIVTTLGVLLIALPAVAAPRLAVTGTYVEARTAEVFTGGCTMNSEAETMGREAVLAWRVDRGSIDGVAVDGLAVVAAVAGDRNLGMREMGGEEPTRVRALVFLDEHASAPQRDALITLVRAATNGLPTEIARVQAVPVVFEHDGGTIRVEAGDASLDVQTHVKHDPSCGAMQWFQPLGEMTRAAIGMTRSQVYWGTALGSKWRQAGKKSAFWGTFDFEDAAGPSQP